MFYLNDSKKSSNYKKSSYYSNNREISCTLKEEEETLQSLTVKSENFVYKIDKVVSLEVAKELEKESGILLKKKENENGFSSFLGGGAFGKVYVGSISLKEENKNESISFSSSSSSFSSKYCGIKIISRNFNECKFEGEIQSDLTKLIPNEEERRLMGLNEIIEFLIFQHFRKQLKA